VVGVGSENSSISRCNFNETLVENLPPPDKKQEVKLERISKITEVVDLYLLSG
jgi:hypothetical protein